MTTCAVAEKTSCQSDIDVHTLTLPAGSCSNDGVVKSFNLSKGYGFVRMQSQADDVYFKTEDFTPRSRQRAQQVSITGASITCEPEAFGDRRARARSIRFVSEAAQSNVKCAESVTPKAAGLDEPSSKVAPTISLAAMAAAFALPPVKKATPARSRGWGTPVQSGQEVSSQKAQLMAMGFTEAAAGLDDALASGLDFNTILDSLLTSGELPSLHTRLSSSDSLPTTGSASEPESCPTTTAGSDDASDNTSACDSAEKSPEAISVEPDMEIASADADFELPLGCDAVMAVAAEEPDVSLSLSFALQSLAEVLPESRSTDNATKATTKATEKAGLPVRQLARVLSSLPEGLDAANLLSVQPGTLIYVWADSATENGWIYAERLDKRSAGWIPADLLKLLPHQMEWRSSTRRCPSFSDQHLAAEQGDIVLVDTESIEQATEGAWIYAERLDGTQAGWFPTCALAETSEKQRWVRVVNSQMALHDSQASVEGGDLVLVDLETRTKEGWAYAWAADRHHGSARAGWVPVNCLEWPQEQ